MSEEATKTGVSVEALFQPYQFGARELQNRVVMAPMTRQYSPGNVVGENVAAYYRRRTEGGTALIITEGTPPNDAGHGHPNVPSIYGEEALAGWKHVVDEVHDAGGAIIPQIWCTGSMRLRGAGPDPDTAPVAPSAVMHPGHREPEKAEIPVEMTQDMIDDTVAAWGEAARNSMELGFDGLEIHGAHSYLIDQFFWEHTNKRTDKYGGDLVARTRFAVEIIEAMRAATSPDFPIVFRFSQWKQGDYDHKMAKTPEELGAFLAPLSDAGVDYFHASQRRFDVAEFEGSDLNLAGWAKKLTGKPSITVGSVGLDDDFLRTYAGKVAHKAGIDALIRRLENDEFDLVGVGRALLSDPAWANKVRDSQEDDIVEFGLEHMKVLT